MRVRSGAAALAVVLGLLPVAVSAQSMPSMMVQTTPHYTISLTLGPVEQMITQSQAMSGATGEVMVNNGGSMSSTMGSSSSMGTPMGASSDMSAMESDMDQGMPANYHLEVHVTTNTNGAVVMNQTPPTIRITDKSTGQFRDLPNVMGMYGAQEGMSDFHYGQNVYLPSGSYVIEVSLGGADSARFNDVMLSGAGMPMASMGMGATNGQSTSTGMGNMGMNPDVASDGAMLSGQPADVQAMFNAIWGARAATAWATEHTASLGMH